MGAFTIASELVKLKFVMIVYKIFKYGDKFSI